MNRFLKIKIKKRAEVISQPMPVQKNLMSKIKLCLPSKIIFLDLAIDQNWRLVKRLESFCEILVIDHHPPTNNLSSRRTVHFNPQFRKKVYQSASYLTFKVLSHFQEFKEKENLWIAMIGIIGDYDLKDSIDLIRKAKRLYPATLPSLEDKDVRSSIFGKLAELITAGKACKIQPEEIVKIVENAKDWKEVLENQKLLEAYTKVHKEIENILIDAKSKFDANKKIFFYEIKSKYSIRSTIATKLAEMWPNKIIVVWQKVRNKVRIACRNQGGKVDVGKLLKSALLPGMKASFGGHPAASGGVIDEKDWEEFKERLERSVEN